MKTPDWNKMACNIPPDQRRAFVKEVRDEYFMEQSLRRLNNLIKRSRNGGKDVH